MRRSFALVVSGLLAAWCWPAVSGGTGADAAASDFRARLPEDEIVYFVLPDRFENGDPPTIAAD